MESEYQAADPLLDRFMGKDLHPRTPPISAINSSTSWPPLRIGAPARPPARVAARVAAVLEEQGQGEATRR